MKKIETIVAPFKLNAVREALSEIGLERMTVSEIKGFGGEKSRKEFYRGSEYTVDFVPKIKIEILLPDAMVPAATEAIQRATCACRIGDGLVIVLAVETPASLRTPALSNEPHHVAVA